MTQQVEHNVHAPEDGPEAGDNLGALMSDAARNARRVCPEGTLEIERGGQGDWLLVVVEQGKRTPLEARGGTLRDALIDFLAGLRDPAASINGDGPAE